MKTPFKIRIMTISLIALSFIFASCGDEKNSNNKNNNVKSNNPAIPAIIEVENITIEMSNTHFQTDRGREKIKAIIVPSNATNKEIEWTSSSNYIWVDSSDYLRCNGSGKVIITATANNGVFASKEIDVIPIMSFPKPPFMVGYYITDLYTSARITKIDWSWYYNTTTYALTDIEFSFSGEKIYDKYGAKSNSRCRWIVKIYDKNDIVVDTKTGSTPDLVVGDKFADRKVKFSANRDKAPYRIEILDDR